MYFVCSLVTGYGKLGNCLVINANISMFWLLGSLFIIAALCFRLLIKAPNAQAFSRLKKDRKLLLINCNFA